MLASKKLRKKVEKKIFLLSCLFMVINNQLEAFAAPAKQAGGNSSMLIVAGVVVAIVIGAVVFLALSKKGKDSSSSKTAESKKTLTPPTVKAPSVPTPKVNVTAPQQKAPITTPTVEPKEQEVKPVQQVQTPVVSQPQSVPSTPQVQTPPPSFTTPVSTPMPKVETPMSDTSVKPLFDSKKLDNDLDNIFASDSPSTESADKKAPLFNSDQLDSDLDALFIEVNKQPEKPKEEEKKGLFDSAKLDSDLDSLFSDSSSSSSKPSQSSAMPINDDLSSLFSTPSTPKVEAPSSAPAFDLDSLDFLGGGSEKKEEKSTSSPAFDLSSLSSEPVKENNLFAETSAPSSFSLDSLDFLGGGSEKKEEKQESFTLPSFDLSSITGNTPTEQPKSEPSIPLTEQKIDLSTTTMGINISDYLSSISSEKKAEPPVEEKKQKSEGIISIGKMLVDQNALEEIIKKAEKGGKAGLTTTQVITAVKGRSLDTLLVDINNINGIMGSLIVGKDGLVIANTMPPDIDKDLVGALTSSLFSNLDGQIKKMKKGNLKRLTVETEIGTYVLTEIEMGTLVVFSDEHEKIQLGEVFKAISTLTGKK